MEIEMKMEMELELEMELDLEVGDAVLGKHKKTKTEWKTNDARCLSRPWADEADRVRVTR
ncbi:GM17335 [Drosophila sechellia]|uniref:GM17335 n=1 Tax=Drosophila sechellia TaxID=7238 RepID=B4I5T4_DROSE|nr:GM17335 [Drosophila sechellia]